MTENNRLCSQYCIDVIRSVMLALPVPAMPDTLSLSQLFSFARMHSVELMVYTGLSELAIDDNDDPVWTLWGNRAEILLAQNLVQLADLDVLTEALTDAGIDLMPIKGCWLKELYPQAEFRQMTDLDIYIRKKDIQKARLIMAEQGYSAYKGDAAVHHYIYQKLPHTVVELHRELLHINEGCEHYYDDVWERAQQVPGQAHLYRFSAEDEYIFYFLHLKGHLAEGGCGIRSILDSMVFRSACPDMDREYLRREFDRLKIAELVRQVEQMADCWFATGCELPASLEDFAEYIISSGAGGTFDNKVRNRMSSLKDKYKNPLIRTLAYLCSMFFVPMDEMKLKYPLLNKAPFLLPLFWVIRMIKKCLVRRGELLPLIKAVLKEGRKNA